jgi:YggT family protein
VSTTLFLLRLVVLTAAGTLCLLALGAMAVQRRRISPFGATARLIRRLSDPLLEPIERRLLRAGGNPRSAPGWLAAVALAGGIVVITVAQWLLAAAWRVRFAASGGARPLTWLLLDWTIALLMLALMVRVIASWFGLGRFSPIMKPFYSLTEWMLRPLRSLVPPLGPFDLTPLVAWFVLLVVRGMLR